MRQKKTITTSYKPKETETRKTGIERYIERKKERERRRRERETERNLEQKN